jgi:hypothetical protein
MTPQGEKLKGTLAQWVACAIWYCADPAFDLEEPSPPVTLDEVIARLRRYNAEFGADEYIDRDEIALLLHQLQDAGEVTPGDIAGTWSLVPYDRSIFR